MKITNKNNKKIVKRIIISQKYIKIIIRKNTQIKVFKINK